MEKHQKKINHSLCFTALVSLMVWNSAWAEEAAPKPAEPAAAKATATLTPTDTPADSAQATSTASMLASPSLTANLTPGSPDAPALAPSVTVLETATPTSSPSLTPTVTPTFTSTPTQTLTPTPTVTSTPGVFVFSISPKPDEHGEIHFKWGTTCPADEAFLGIYTSGYRIVRKFSFNKNEKPEYLATGEHEYTWNGMDENKRLMAPGTYLCFIQVNVGKKRYEASGKTEMP